MMYIYNILLVLVIQVSSLHVPPGQWYNDVLIQWATNCDQYDTIAGRAPWLDYIRKLPYNVTESECRANCTGDRECGGYVVNPQCRLYNINHQIINQYLNDTPYWNHTSGGAFYSKSCQYDTGYSDLSCNVYSTSAIIDYIYPALAYMWTYSPGMTAAQCQSWCTLYTECKNAAYRYVTNASSPYADHAWCYLHDATMEELLADGWRLENGTDTTYTTNVNYNRFCSDGSPYIPGAPKPSSGIRLVASVWVATVTVIIMITMPMWKLY